VKKIEAIVKPFMLDEVRDALTAVGAPGVTVSEVNGFGRQKGHTEHHRGAEYEADFLPRIKLEIVVPDDAVEKVSNAVLDVCRTGRIGDGKIFVETIAGAVSIRSGAQDDAAVSGG
jgi:nitrogen regulatory protein P-II 1